MNQLNWLVLLCHKHISMDGKIYFDGKIFKQVDGVTLGSPLGPALANLFMGSNEQKLLESDHGRLANFTVGM